jgi:hypothetical protein
MSTPIRLCTHMLNPYVGDGRAYRSLERGAFALPHVSLYFRLYIHRPNSLAPLQRVL